jgi:hypothetical protein
MPRGIQPRIAPTMTYGIVGTSVYADVVQGATQLMGLVNQGRRDKSQAEFQRSALDERKDMNRFQKDQAGIQNTRADTAQENQLRRDKAGFVLQLGAAIEETGVLPPGAEQIMKEYGLTMGDIHANPQGAKRAVQRNQEVMNLGTEGVSLLGSLYSSDRATGTAGVITEGDAPAVSQYIQKIVPGVDVVYDPENKGFQLDFRGDEDAKAKMLAEAPEMAPYIAAEGDEDKFITADTIDGFLMDSLSEIDTTKKGGWNTYNKLDAALAKRATSPERKASLFATRKLKYGEQLTSTYGKSLASMDRLMADPPAGVDQVLFGAEMARVREELVNSLPDIQESIAAVTTDEALHAAYKTANTQIGMATTRATTSAKVADMRSTLPAELDKMNTTLADAPVLWEGAANLVGQENFAEKQAYTRRKNAVTPVVADVFDIFHTQGRGLPEGAKHTMTSLQSSVVEAFANETALSANEEASLKHLDPTTYNDLKDRFPEIFTGAGGEGIPSKPLPDPKINYGG